MGKEGVVIQVDAAELSTALRSASGDQTGNLVSQAILVEARTHAGHLPWGDGEIEFQHDRERIPGAGYIGGTERIVYPTCARGQVEAIARSIT